MLRFMRRHRQSFIIKGVFGVIILAFVGWGVGSYEAARTTASVALVNGVKITVADLTRAHQNLIRTYQSLWGASYSPELAQQLDLQGQALDGLITVALLTSEAERLGLRVTDEEVADSIRSMPVFSNSGRFDRAAYLRFLRFNQVTDEQFVEQQRTDLLTRRVESLITDGAQVTDEEVRDRYLIENERVNLRYVTFSGRALRDTITLGDEDIAAYYQDHGDRYRNPERVAFDYVAYRPEDFASSASVTEDEVTEFYERHVEERFSDPPQVHLLQIVLNIPAGANEEERAQIRVRAEDLAREAATGDFGELAHKHSEDESTADKDGEVGWVARESLQPALANAAFALAKGAVSEPVELTEAIYVLKAEDTRGARPRPLDEVRSQIEDAIRAQKGASLARAAADDGAARVASGGTLEDAAQAYDLTPKQSRLLSARDSDPELGPTASLVGTVLRLEVGETSNVVETTRGFFLLRPLEKAPAEIPPLDEVRARAEADLRGERAQAAAREKAEAFLAALQETKDLDALAPQEGLTVGETGAFGRIGRLGRPIPRLGVVEGLKDDAFERSTSDPVAPKVYTTAAGDALIAMLKERIAPELDELEQKRDTLRDGYLQRKKQALLSAFITQLKQQASIEISTERLPQT
jgi:peptidyl-prolyl cis-trans isomerase D